MSHWKGIEDEVRDFTLANWERWEEEKPEWWTQKLKARVPDRFMPVQSVVALGGVGRERRGSAGLTEVEAAELRGSIGRLSFGGGGLEGGEGGTED